MGLSGFKVTVVSVKLHSSTSLCTIKNESLHINELVTVNFKHFFAASVKSLPGCTFLAQRSGKRSGKCHRFVRQWAGKNDQRERFCQMKVGFKFLNRIFL